MEQNCENISAKKGERMKTQWHRVFTPEVIKDIAGLLIFAMVLLLCGSDGSLAASAKDAEKQTIAPSAPSSAGQPTGTAPSPTAPASGIMMHEGPAEWLPRVTIDYFKKAPAPGTMVTTMGGTAPDSITVQYGESITLHWGIKACNIYNITVTASGTWFGPETTLGSDMQHHTTPDGCTYYQGERTFEVHSSGSSTLRVRGSPSDTRNFPSQVDASKSYYINVPEPSLNIGKPEINENTMEVTFLMGNTGTGDITSGTFNVSFNIEDPTTNVTICRNSFTTSPLDIPRGGRNVRLGSVSLDSHRRELFARNSVKIKVYIDNLNTRSDAQPRLEDRRTFSHTWERKTFVIDSTLLRTLSALSSYRIRLNNYNIYAPRYPYVDNDSYVRLNLMGVESSPNFSIERYVEEVLIAIPPSPIPIMQEVAIYVNNIVASQTSPSDLFSIRDGKLVIHLEFPNSGSREIKTGFHNWGTDNVFRDDPVGDIELGPFSVDILLAPQLRSGKVSYGEVEIQIQELSSSVVGAMDDTLNRSGMVRRFLNRTISGIIVAQLSGIVNSDRVRTAFEDGIANNLPRGITRILGISARGNTITLNYL
jgi:hypothetical protein